MITNSGPLPPSFLDGTRGVFKIHDNQCLMRAGFSSFCTVHLYRPQRSKLRLVPRNICLFFQSTMLASLSTPPPKTVGNSMQR